MTSPDRSNTPRPARDARDAAWRPARATWRRALAGAPWLVASLLAALPAAGWTLDDSLSNATVGTRFGGQLGPSGWTTTGTDDRIVYVVPRLVSGSVEFTVTGLTIDAIPAVDHEIFAMYDGYGLNEPVGYSPYFRNNAFKMLVRIYGQGEPSRTGMQKLLYSMCPLGPPGYGDGSPCPCPVYYNEEPFGGDTSFGGGPDTFRVEWTPTTSAYFRNGSQVHTLDWGSTGILWGPEELHIMLGSPRNELGPDVAMPVGVTFSNVHINGTEGAATPACLGGSGGSGSGGGGVGGGGSADCSTELSAVSLSPTSGVGTAVAYDAVYRYTGGADQLRVAQLFVGASLSTDVPNMNLAMDASTITLGDGQTCAIGAPSTLQGIYGSIDCAESSYAIDGTDATVHWAVSFNPTTMVGSHGVYMDAKANGTPEPRLCWQLMGDWEVPGASGGAGGSGQGGAGTTGGAGGAGAEGAGTPTGGSSAGGAPVAESTDGGDCGCAFVRAPRSSDALAWLAAALGAMGARRRGRPVRRRVP